jgi:hypothetical protein
MIIFQLTAVALPFTDAVNCRVGWLNGVITTDPGVTVSGPPGRSMTVALVDLPPLVAVIVTV